jgi:hypothetical protein
MNTLEQLKQERLKRTESILRLAGCERCKICNYWVDKFYIIKDGICNECIDKKELKK